MKQVFDIHGVRGGRSCGELVDVVRSMPGMNSRSLHVEIGLWRRGGARATEKSHRPILVSPCPYVFVRTSLHPFNVLSFLSQLLARVVIRISLGET